MISVEVSRRPGDGVVTVLCCSHHSVTAVKVQHIEGYLQTLQDSAGVMLQDFVGQGRTVQISIERCRLLFGSALQCRTVLHRTVQGSAGRCRAVLHRTVRGSAA